MNKRIIVFLLSLFIFLGHFLLNTNKNDSSLNLIESDEIKETTNSSLMIETDDYDGDSFIYININQPNFTDEEKKQTDSKIVLSELDRLGRCGAAYEVIGTDLLPTEERKDISSVYPSGWHQAQYGAVYVYNRTHLLGYAESGLNDEPRNLITATSQMNQDVMTLFENDIRNYVKDTNNHVVYRVTPNFQGDELVARGVQLEAWSVEDGGQGICLNVYFYNVQDGINIDYETGYTSSSDYIQESLNQ